MFIRAVLCHNIGLVCLEAVQEFCWFQKQKSDRLSSSAEACLLYILLLEFHVMQAPLSSAHDQIHVDSASYKSLVHQSALLLHRRNLTAMPF